MSKLYSIGEAAEKLGISIITLRRWDKKGQINTINTPGGHRRIEESEINRLLGKAERKANKGNAYLYCRVSTKKQADNGNLDRQEDRLIAYAYRHGYNIVNVFKEVASGINENRKQLLKLLNGLKEKQAEFVIVEYKDRLARFGYEYLYKYITDIGASVVIVDTKENKDIQQELVEDLIAITTSFSARIYGARGGRVAKKLQQIIESEVDIVEDNSTM